MSKIPTTLKASSTLYTADTGKRLTAIEIYQGIKTILYARIINIAIKDQLNEDEIKMLFARETLYPLIVH